MPDNKIRFNDLEYGTAKISHIKARLNDKKWEPLFKFYTENYTEVERNREELVLSSRNNFGIGVEDTNNNNELDDEEIMAFKNAHSQFKDLTLEDFKTFYETFIEVSKEDADKEEAESTTATKAKLKNLPENVLKWANENSKVKKTNYGYLIENTELSDIGIKKQVIKLAFLFIIQ